MSMKNIARSVGLLVLAVLCSATLANAHAQDDRLNVPITKIRFDYDHSATWGYNYNSTNLYSPIDIPASAAVANPAAQYFKVYLKKNFDAIVREDIAVNVVGDFGYLKTAGADGQIVKIYPESIRFRTPAENLINGLRYDTELRLCFRTDKEGPLNYIVSVFLRAATTDLDSEDVFRDLMREAGVRAEPIIYQSARKAGRVSLPDVLRNFFSAGKRFFHFVGGLPFPPFTQNINWYVFEQPLDVSRDDIEFLRFKYSSNKFNNGNASPLQPLNGRAISYNTVSLAAPAVGNNRNNNRDDDCDSNSDRNNNRNHGHNDDSNSDSYRNKRNNNHGKHY